MGTSSALGMHMHGRIGQVRAVSYRPLVLR